MSVINPSIPGLGPCFQYNRTRYESAVVGGPITMSFPAAEFLLLNDDPSTGDIVYSATTPAEYQSLCVGRVIYVCKSTTNAPGFSVILRTPPGINFSSTGTNELVLPNTPVSYALFFLPNGPVGVVQGVTGGGGGVNTIYNMDDFLVSDRVVHTGDKKLSFQLDALGSSFSVSKDTSPFPPTIDETAAIHVEPYDFLGSGKPAAIMGYVRTVAPNDSVGFLASEVPGDKSAMIVSTNNNNNTNNIILVTDGGVQIQAETIPDISTIAITSTSIAVGTPSLSLQIPPPTNLTATEILTRNTGTGEVELLPVASLPPPTPVNVYNTDGSLTGDRVVSTGDFNLTIQGDGNFVGNGNWSMDQIEIHGRETEMNCYPSILQLRSAEGGPANTINLDGPDNTIYYSSGKHSFTVTNNEFAIDGIPNSTAPKILYYDDTSKLVSYEDAPSSGSNIYNTSGVITDNVRVVDLDDNAISFIGGPGGGVSPSNTFSVTDTYNNTLTCTNNSRVAAGVNVILDAPAIEITQIPPLNPAATDILCRNTATGELEILDVTSLPAPAVYGASLTLTVALPVPLNFPTQYMIAPLALSLASSDFVEGGIVINYAAGEFTVPAGIYHVDVQLQYRNSLGTVASPDNCTFGLLKSTPIIAYMRVGTQPVVTPGDNFLHFHSILSLPADTYTFIFNHDLFSATAEINNAFSHVSIVRV